MISPGQHYFFTDRHTIVRVVDSAGDFYDITYKYVVAEMHMIGYISTTLPYDPEKLLTPSALLTRLEEIIFDVYEKK